MPCAVRIELDERMKCSQIRRNQKSEESDEIERGISVSICVSEETDHPDLCFRLKPIDSQSGKPAAESKVT